MKRSPLFLVALISFVSLAVNPAHARDLTDTAPPKIVSMVIDTSVSAVGLRRYLITVQDDKNWVSLNSRDWNAFTTGFKLVEYSEDKFSPKCTPSSALRGSPILEFKEVVSKRSTKVGGSQTFVLTVQTIMSAYTDDGVRIPEECKIKDRKFSIEDYLGSKFIDEAGNLSGSLPTISDVSVTTIPIFCQPSQSFEKYQVEQEYYPLYRWSASYPLKEMKKLIGEIKNKEDVLVRQLISEVKSIEMLANIRNKAADNSRLLMLEDLSNWEKNCAILHQLETRLYLSSSTFSLDLNYLKLIRDEELALANLELVAKNEADAKTLAEARAKSESEARVAEEFAAKQEEDAKAKLLADEKEKADKAAAAIRFQQESDTGALWERLASALKAKKEKIAADSKKATITCIKGKLIKKVTAVKPVCPKGYKKK